jgi:acetyl-CoA carboxylase biotin carboxylase subunit
MFRKVLVANRGEIALRIIRACQELGVKTVVVYSEADRASLPVLLADQAVCIGPAPAARSYLNFARVLEAGYATGCEAVHPGYGFLSERAEFADAAADTHMAFIGPKPEAMRLLGDKIAARELMHKAEVPISPGSIGEIRDLRRAAQISAEVGYPVMVKAAAGGGGRGMRMVNQPRDLETGIRLCQAEAGAAFGDPRVYLEKVIFNARHIEIQILADGHGRVVHLGERDCSAQRRHQKFIEECPSPAVDSTLRRKLGNWAIAAAQASGYTNAGTVEFLVDQQGQCFFLEVNCRLQVEHPITELASGVDIVREQIRIAAGEPLAIPPDAGTLRGHALECRLCAEDPDADFEPMPGRVTRLHLPSGTGVRVDSHLYAGYEIPPFYDSLIAKVVAWAPTRDQAIRRLDRALSETEVEGVITTIPFLRDFLKTPDFQAGRQLTSRRE